MQARISNKLRRKKGRVSRDLFFFAGFCRFRRSSQAAAEVSPASDFSGLGILGRLSALGGFSAFFGFSAVRPSRAFRLSPASPRLPPSRAWRLGFLQRRAEDVAERSAAVGRAVLRHRLLLFGDLQRLDREGRLLDRSKPLTRASNFWPTWKRSARCSSWSPRSVRLMKPVAPRPRLGLQAPRP